MDTFLFYSKLGLFHVLDWNALDHLLFLVVLCLPYASKQWRNLIWLITVFTIGHSVSLALSVYGVVKVNVAWIEFLIVVTIMITALYNILSASRFNSDRAFVVSMVSALFFGLIHGLGFSTYFKQIISPFSSKLLPLIEFALGVELAQLIIGFVVFLVSFIWVGLLKKSRRDFILVVSAIVLGVVLPMIFNAKLS